MTTTQQPATPAVRCPYHGVDGLAQSTRHEWALGEGRREVCNIVTDQHAAEICGMTLSLGSYAHLEQLTEAGKADPNAVVYIETHRWDLGVGWVSVPLDQAYGRYQCQACRCTVTLPRDIAGPDCSCGAYAWEPAHGADVAPDFDGQP